MVVEGKEFRVHKAILGAQSPVFAAMFEHETKEQVENRVEIPDMSSDVFEHLLRFIYSGKVPEMDKVALDLLSVADQVFLFVLNLLRLNPFLRISVPGGPSQIVVRTIAQLKPEHRIHGQHFTIG